jgi:hypothetical protein
MSSEPYLPRKSSLLWSGLDPNSEVVPGESGFGPGFRPANAPFLVGRPCQGVATACAIILLISTDRAPIFGTRRIRDVGVMEDRLYSSSRLAVR